VHLLAPRSEQARVGRIPDQSVLERVDRVGQRAAAVKQLGGHELVERLLQLRFGAVGNGRKQREGELAADHRADLGDLLDRSQTVEASRQRIVQRGRNRQRRQWPGNLVPVGAASKKAGIQHCLSQLLDEERHAVGPLDDLLQHLVRQSHTRAYAVDDCRHLMASQPAQAEGCHMRITVPGRPPLRTVGHDQERAHAVKPLNKLLKQLLGGRITQQFNTTTSMGRLTLNILLSFAQFEREVIGERIRDKFAASRRKGMWMGGWPPLGYEVENRRLVVVDSEAALVRRIFDRFAKTGSALTVARELNAAGEVTKRRQCATGPRGGKPWTKGAVYKVLANRVYLGEAVYKGVAFPGEHAAITDQRTWDKAPAVMAEPAHRRGAATRTQVPALLKGLIFGPNGRSMSPSHTRRRGRTAIM
jgi:Recombinase/Resolvase, N terminal domain